MSHEQVPARRWRYGAIAAAGLVATVVLAPSAAADSAQQTSGRTFTTVVPRDHIAVTPISVTGPIKVSKPPIQMLCLGCVNPGT